MCAGLPLREAAELDGLERVLFAVVFFGVAAEDFEAVPEVLLASLAAATVSCAIAPGEAEPHTSYAAQANKQPRNIFRVRCRPNVIPLNN